MDSWVKDKILTQARFSIFLVCGRVGTKAGLRDCFEEFKSREHIFQENNNFFYIKFPVKIFSKKIMFRVIVTDTYLYLVSCASIERWFESSWILPFIEFKDSVVYMCSFSKCMQHKMALPVWHHARSLKKIRVSRFGPI